MKTIYKFFIPIASLLLLANCSKEDLSLESPNDPLFDEITSFGPVVEGMYDAYQKIPANEYLITELRSDNMVSDSGDGDLGNIESFNFNADLGESSFYWANNYSVVLNANIVIDNEANFRADDDEASQFLGEAYFMRALSHFNLVRGFLNVPYIDRVVKDSKDVLNFPQLAPEVVYQKIIDDFLNAILFLEKGGSQRVNNRANLGAAHALLAKVYMSQPTPNYPEALAHLSDLADESNPYGYKLMDKFNDAFDKEDTYDRGVLEEINNTEALLVVSYGDSGPAVTASIRFQDQVQGDSQLFSFTMSAAGRAGGIVYTDDFLAQVLAPEVDEPVRGSDVEKNSLVYAWNPVERKYFDKKFDDGTDDTSEKDWIVLRYADVLLLHAEAILAGAGSTTDLSAITSYNLVRARAKVSELPLDGAAILTKEALLRERRVELSFENHRLYDLIRFGEAAETLSKYSAENGLNFEETNLYLPIPQREIDVTGGFYNQNLGY